MPNPLLCPACGKRYDVPAEYLRDNAGLETDCTCGHAIPIPAAPPQLSYAAPEFPPKPVRGVWADGVHVVVARGTRMPDRCCICNEPVPGEIRPQTLRWVPPEHDVGYFSLRPIGLVRFLIGSAIADSYSQSIVVRIGRCPKHTHLLTPKQTGWIFLGTMLTGIIGTCIMARTQQETIAGLLGFAALGIVGMILLWRASKMKAVNFHGNYAWIEGFGDPYLIALPPFQEEIEQTLQRTADAMEQIQDDDAE